MLSYDAANDVFIDYEIGRIRIRRTHGRTISLDVKTDARIVLSAPTRVSAERLRQYIEQNRDALSQAVKRARGQRSYHNGDKVGRRHTLVVKLGVRPAVRIDDRTIMATVTSDMSQADTEQYVHGAVARALKREAVRYLPRRLARFALEYGYHYKSVRISFAKTRWGSCSSNGTISLNVALMTLPSELCDYVLLHELAHTREMNHGTGFWRELESHLPQARSLNAELKDYSPYI